MAKGNNNVIKESPDFLRQVVVTGLNQSVTIISSDENENVDFLLEKAYKIFMKIKNGERENEL